MRKISIYIAAIMIVVIVLCVFIFFINPDNPSHNVLDVKKYEHIIQSSDSSKYDWWQEWFFTDSLHHKYANEIYYMETYEDYFALLNEFYPIELPENATDYDRYEASLIQFDSLMAFPGDEGATVQIYLYEGYQQTFTYFTKQRTIDLLKSKTLYSAEVDSAWSKYLNVMEMVIDSVVMYRPQCLGTISGMESYTFTGFLNNTYLNSLLETLFYMEMDVPQHMTITDEIMNAAYDTLRAHQEEPDTEYDDLLECYVPVATRIDAINQDQAAWNNFLNARSHFEKKLHGAQRKAYRNATNNLKWSKLWLLKQEYHSFKISEYSFQELLLPLNCTNDELMNYNFHKIHNENGYSKIN